ncbi:hypothetical protein [Nocardioides alcanivorans]|uniref:hypothetical protein n=1 Tax=Nocardioides alcanivorans TaxID=2897352 RepID=UPI001F491391|nr:hypothetical protein [Nocardioides alcanivorans]
MRSLGDTDTIDQRRAKAIGRLTDDTEQPTLDYTGNATSAGDSSSTDSTGIGTDAVSAAAVTARR